jgi:putative ABC transport system substrate-binding protein
MPIVALMADPVTFGLVSNLKSPEANLTGVSVDAGLEIWGKRLGLLIEAASNIRRAALLLDGRSRRSDGLLVGFS